jgi:hypothetical protein
MEDDSEVLQELPYSLDGSMVQIDALAPKESVRTCKETTDPQPLIHSSSVGDGERVIIRWNDGKYATVQRKTSFGTRTALSG